MKAALISEILQGRGSISKETGDEITAYIKGRGNMEVIRKFYDCERLRGNETRPFCNLISRGKEFDKIDNMVRNRIMPLAKKSNLIGLILSYNKLSTKQTKF